MSYHRCGEDDVCDDCHFAAEAQALYRAGGNRCVGQCGRILPKGSPDECQECNPAEWCVSCGVAAWDCKGCGRDCSCDTHDIHDRAMDEEIEAFLASPGAPPAHFSEEQITRCQAAINIARRVRDSVST